jgi:NTE family protein
VAMGTGSAEIESLLRERFSPEMVRAVFSLAFSGASPGYPAMEALLREVAGGRDVSDLVIPFVALAVDLNSRRPVALTSGSLAEALLASTALPGLFPPFERAGQRLVDGLALVPVPVSAVQDCGADVTVAVNLMSIDTLPAWPGESSPPPVAGKQRMLETLLEVMELTQTDASTRHAALADVVITPSFGPCTWRDFHLAERFTAAGREAALGSLDQLRALATPMQPGRQVGTPGPC